MKKIKVTICTGTACFVMGASELMLLGEKLPPELKDKVEIAGCTCMEKCKNSCASHPPYVTIDGQIIENANLVSVIEKISQLAKN